MTRVEDRLREHYRDEVAGLEVPDLLPRVLAAGRRARRRSRLAATVGIAGVVAAAAVGSVLVLGPAISQRPAHRPASRPYTVITRTSVSPFWGPVSGMAAVPGGVWLASWEQGELVRIDAGSGHITARVRVGRPQDGVNSIAYGAGSLWVTDSQTGGLLRLDPATGRPLATVHLPGGAFGDVAVGGGFVWVDQWGPADGSLYRLAKVSPVTGRLVARRRIPGKCGPGGLTIAGSATGAWVYVGYCSVQAVDPASLRLLGSARTGGDLAATGPRVWTLSQGTLSRIDPPWTTVARRVQLYPNPDNVAPRYSAQNLGAQTLVPGPARTLWAAGPALYQVDETTMRAQTISRFGPVDNVSVIGQTLWVQTEDQFGYHQYVYQLALHRASSPPPG